MLEKPGPFGPTYLYEWEEVPEALERADMLFHQPFPGALGCITAPQTA